MSNSTYYLGRKRKRKRHSLKLLISVVLLVSIILFINSRVYPIISSYVKAHLETTLSADVNQSVSLQMAKDPTLFENVITMTQKSDGTLSSLNVNVPKLLIARTVLVSDILNSLNFSENIEIPFPLGNLTGISIFSGKGPTVSIDDIISNGFNAYFENSFSELGINQTLYQITFTVCFNVNIIFPSGIESFKISQSFPVLSTIIVGDVPDAYTKIHRLTDDISESEIDDIYDFGASKS